MKIVLFRGRPAVGKSTLANALAAQTMLSLLSKDALYDPLALFIEKHQDRNKAVHNVLYSILEQNKDREITFILDFPFQYDEDFLIISNWCNTRKVELKSVLITCSDERLWKKRLEARSENPTPNQLITDFSLLTQYYKGNMQLRPVNGELCIDTVEPVNSLLPKIVSYLSL